VLRQRIPVAGGECAATDGTKPRSTIESVRIKTPAPQPGRRDQAEQLRIHATSIRAELQTAELALQERRDADEAGKLEAKADELELEQRRIDKAAELRSQADAADAEGDRTRLGG